MSLANNTDYLRFTTPANVVRPFCAMVATKRSDAVPVTNKVFQVYSGYMYVQFGMTSSYFVFERDASGNMGQLPTAKIDPNTKADAYYTAGTWDWWLMSLTSNSLRKGRFGAFDFGISPNGNEDHSAAPQPMGNMPWSVGDQDAATRWAQLHLFTSDVSVSDFNAVRAGTKNPVDITGHLDGWTLKNDMTSLKGLITLTTENGATPTYNASDDPVVPAAGTTGGGTGAKLVMSGFGW